MIYTIKIKINHTKFRTRCGIFFIFEFMRKIAVLLILCFQVFNAQKLDFNLLLKDKISIRAIQIVDGKVYYVGTDSKLGYVHLKDTIRKKQVRLSQYCPK